MPSEGEYNESAKHDIWWVLFVILIVFGVLSFLGIYIMTDRTMTIPEHVGTFSILGVCGTGAWATHEYLIN